MKTLPIISPEQSAVDAWSSALRLKSLIGGGSVHDCQAAMRYWMYIVFFGAMLAMTSATSFAVEQPEPIFFLLETNAVVSARLVLAAVRDGDTQTRTNIQSLIGHNVVFIGGTAPRGTNADLTLGDDIILKVEIRPFRDVRPQSVMWESEVFGRLDSVDFSNRVIRITTSSENWKVRQTW